jgi:uncharacterized RDD family membrane protein YckC
VTTFRDYQNRRTQTVADLRMETLPQGAREFQGTRAGLMTRLAAGALDVLFLFAVVLGIALAGWMLSFVVSPLNPLGTTEDGLRRIPAVLNLVIIGYVLAWLYFTVCWSTSGRTLGNLIMGVRVINFRGTRLHWPAAALRSLFVMVFPIGLFWVIVSGANRSVQDVVLRTSVTYDWVVGVPTLAGILGRNREAQAR